jgi:hypothetical protein
MRKITSKAIAAFTNARNFRDGSTVVEAFNGGVYYILHGNVIARNIDGEGLSINLCGWNTNTTRDRLNGIPGVSVSTRKGQAYLNGNPIPDSGWILV